MRTKKEFCARFVDSPPPKTPIQASAMAGGRLTGGRRGKRTRRRTPYSVQCRKTVSSRERLATDDLVLMGYGCASLTGPKEGCCVGKQGPSLNPSTYIHSSRYGGSRLCVVRVHRGTVLYLVMFLKKTKQQPMGVPGYEPFLLDQIYREGRRIKWVRNRMGTKSCVGDGPGGL